MERVFRKAESFPLQILRKGEVDRQSKPQTTAPESQEPAVAAVEYSFWDKVHVIEEDFHKGLERHEPKEATNALLELDRAIWKAQQDLESHELISQARDTLREMIVSLGIRVESAPKSRASCLAPLVEELLELRQKLRREKHYDRADEIRESLKRAEVIVEDSKDGSMWRLK
jgi:cysteinyl-tRNA synthetase